MGAAPVYGHLLSACVWAPYNLIQPVSRLSKKSSLNSLPETHFFPVDKDCSVRDDGVAPLVWQHLETGRQVVVAFLEETKAGRK